MTRRKNIFEELHVSWAVERSDIILRKHSTIVFYVAPTSCKTLIGSLRKELYVARVRLGTLLVNVREREREKEAGLTYQENLQSCREFRGGRRALRLIATAPANCIPISRFPVRSPASGVSLSLCRDAAAPVINRDARGETSEPCDGSRYRDGAGTVIRPMVLASKRATEYRVRGSTRRDLIDLDGFSPPRSCLIRPKVVSDVLANPRPRAFRFIKPDAISFPVCKWRNRARGDDRAPLRKTERA